MENLKTWFDELEMPEKELGKFIDKWSETHDMPLIRAWCKEADNTYVAVDNNCGECWVEEFDSKINCAIWLSDSYASYNDGILEKRGYSPESKDELRALVSDPSIDLCEIDTSHITDMSNLLVGIKRDNFAGIETWDTSNVKDMSNFIGDCLEAYNHFSLQADMSTSPAFVSFPDIVNNLDNYRTVGLGQEWDIEFKVSGVYEAESESDYVPLGMLEVENTEVVSDADDLKKISVEGYYTLHLQAANAESAIKLANQYFRQIDFGMLRDASGVITKMTNSEGRSYHAIKEIEDLPSGKPKKHRKQQNIQNTF